MDYYFLDLVPWQDSQTLYHANAYLGRESLALMRPATPYVCLGCHQDARQELDLEFAEQAGLPILRREVGGGATYLDSGQLFYQIVLRKDHPEVPGDKSEFYRKFLQPVADTYRHFGIAAEFRPVNDLIYNNRKISGNGAGEIEGMVVLVGNFILDFNYEMMARVLRVPDEKFRDKVFKTLGENLTTIRRETGSAPSTEDLADALATRLEPIMGPFERKTSIDAELRAMADARFAEMSTPEWLFANDRRQVETQVKIREGVYVIQKVVKLPGGLVRLTAASQDGRLSGVHLSGDFFIFPTGALQDLERALEGAPLDTPFLATLIDDFFKRHTVQAPGISPHALADIIATA